MIYRKLLIVLLAIGFSQGLNASAEDFNPVIGKAGAMELREADVDRLLSYQPADVQKMLNADSVKKNDFVRQLLLTRLVAEKARAVGFDKKPDIREQMGYVADQFIAQEYLNKVIAEDVTVSTEELKGYYKEHEKEFVIPERVKARQIFVEMQKDADAETRANTRTKVDKILGELKDGEDFAKLAGQFSQDKDTADNGGDLGWISPGMTNSAEFEKSLFSLKVGEISSIETPFGFHVVRVDERQEKRIATFDETRKYIMIKLKEEAGRKQVTLFLEKLAKDKGLEVFGDKAGGN